MSGKPKNVRYPVRVDTKLASKNVTGPASAPAPPSVATHQPYNPRYSLLSKKKISELVSQVDSKERLDAEVEDVLLDIADDFIENVTSFACMLAKHRRSKKLEVKDMQLHLERNWGISIPGFGRAEEIKTHRNQTTDAHKQRLQQKRKSVAAYATRAQRAKQARTSAAQRTPNTSTS